MIAPIGLTVHEQRDGQDGVKAKLHRHRARGGKVVARSREIGDMHDCPVDHRAPDHASHV